jgi:predicted RNase H-like HicB family nuclease
MKTFTAIINQEEDMYVARCSEIGTVSQGKTIEEALANLKEATELYLEEFPAKGKKNSFLTTFEVGEVAKA